MCRRKGGCAGCRQGNYKGGEFHFYCQRNETKRNETTLVSPWGLEMMAGWIMMSAGPDWHIAWLSGWGSASFLLSETSQILRSFVIIVIRFHSSKSSHSRLLSTFHHGLAYQDQRKAYSGAAPRLISSPWYRRGICAHSSTRWSKNIAWKNIQRQRLWHVLCSSHRNRNNM